MEKIFAEQTFGREHFKEKILKDTEYDTCVFGNCDLNGADLSASVFIDCSFTGCDLSLIKVHNTVFRDAKFVDCKMLGIHFENCNKFGLTFSVNKCSMSHSSFYRRSLKKTLFEHTELLEVDFTESDLTSCIFDDCNLHGAKFENTILEKTDFRTAHNYSINPEINRIKKAKFSNSGLAGLLDKYDIIIE